MSNQPTAPRPAEISRPFKLAEFDVAPQHTIEIVTTAAERNALAERYSLLSLDALAAQMTMRRDPSGEITVEGRLQAKVIQKCVVTLEPVSETVDAPFEQRYTGRPDEAADDLVIGPGEAEPPEPVIGDSIDLGELVAEYLSLSLNPYPRAPDADEKAADYKAEALDGGPFGALAKLLDPD